MSDAALKVDPEFYNRRLLDTETTSDRSRIGYRVGEGRGAGTGGGGRGGMNGGYSAPELADYLVRELKLPFRDAHHVTGQIVALAEEKGIDLPDLSAEDMQSVESRLTDDVFSVLSVEASAQSRHSYGGTSPVRVTEQVEQWKQRLGL